MNPFLAIGQIIVSIALIVAILLQARGTGLSGTFGGDSAVYRSRRGIERRLWQFTILLAVLFAVFSLASYVFAAGHGLIGRRRPGVHRPMTRRDVLVVLLLGAVLAALVGTIGYPGAPAGRAARPIADACPGPRLPGGRSSASRPPSSPVGARTQADRDLVALLFRGLVRLGPGEELLPDLAERWTVSDKGRTLDVRPAQRRTLAGWPAGDQPPTSSSPSRVLQRPGRTSGPRAGPGAR